MAKTRPRKVRRAAERAEEKLTLGREKLFRLDLGGSPERPLEVPTPALVEPSARSLPCPSCGAAHEVLEHAAVKRGDARLREARLRCTGCGARRSLWFCLVNNQLN